VVIRHRLSAPAVLALGAFVAGSIGIASALTPEFADRSRLVRGVLPPGIPNAARVLALAFGILLIWLSLSLARRKYRAWKLAVALVSGSAVLHIVKGLDFEETLVSLMLLAALWYWRDEFVARGDPTTRLPVLQALSGLAAIGVLIWLRWSDHVGYSERLEDALIVVAALLAARALYFWLRPFAQRGRSSPEERAAAVELVRAEGHDSLCYFALRRDKSYFFSPSGRSFLAYAVISGSAIVSGDPIGERTEFIDLLLEFKRVALARAWRVAVINASEELLPVYHRVGLKSWYIGDEAIVRPITFSLEGRAIRKVRQAVTRVEKSGYREQIVDVAEITPAQRTEIEEVSTEWRGRAPERGFSMAMDTLFTCPGSVVAFAEDASGRIGGFIHLVPSPASGGYSLSTMRRRDDVPNGLMEYLIVQVLVWAKEHEVPEVSLNFAMFGRILRADSESPRHRRALRFALIKLDRFFQVERLHSFNRKFFPEWRPRYFCFERYADLPLLAVAYGHVEGFVVLPAPWAKTTDLTTA
jgi:lysyl-tRNA synthetase, class II